MRIKIVIELLGLYLVAVMLMMAMMMTAAANKLSSTYSLTGTLLSALLTE